MLCAEEQLSAVIGQWLTCLPQEDRIVFLRRYWYGDSLAAIAKARGTGQNHLAVRMHRLRKRLREYLKEEGIAV